MALRTLVLLVLAPILVIGGFQVLRVPGDLTEDVFWARKMQWTDTFDIVVAGDSRAYQDISPAELETFLPAARIGNFGFSSAALAGPYLDRVRSLLSPGSKRPIILLAVTPHALTVRALSENGFASEGSRDGAALRANTWMGWLRQLVAPLSLDEIAVMLRDRSMFVGSRVFHANGWVESISPVYATLPAFDWARADFGGNPVSPLLLDHLSERIREWRTEGIDVYAFPMPVAPGLEELESRLSGFDRETVAQALRDAGAVWLTPPEGFLSYDGSHLTGSSAIAFSRWLGGAMAVPGSRGVRP